MSDNPLLGITAIFVLGIGAQWLAWRLRLPAILLLLLAGILAGPGTEYLASRGVLDARFLDPNHLFGPLLLPLVSLSVGIILFEGGLTLTLNQISGVGHVVGKLVTVGAGVMWVCASVAARYCLDFPWPLALLLGAILVVTGPTVIGPLLRHVRPVGQVGPVLRWEGIVIDPIGALLAVLVFQALEFGGNGAGVVILKGLLLTTLIGVGVGTAGAALLIVALRHYRVPDYLQNPVALMVVAAAFATSNSLQYESGIFATTVMGIVLANQRLAPVHHILEFKENLSVLLISALFIVLGARLDVGQLTLIRWPHVLFIAALILVARPLSVAASTLSAGFTWRERLFIAWMAPRGVVAASVASVFAIELTESHMPGGEQLVPAVFAVIVGTVTVYGLTAAPLARRLGLAKPDSLGFLLVGANPVARLVGRALHDAGYEVLLVDTSQENVSAARFDGVPAFFGSVNSEQVFERVQLSGIGRLLAMTPSDTVNALAAARFVRLFGRADTYQLPPHAPTAVGGVDTPFPRTEKLAHEQRGRLLFSPNLTYSDLAHLVESGAALKRTKLTEQFNYARFRAASPGAVPLFVLDQSGSVHVVSSDNPPTPRPGQTLISLAPRSDSPPAPPPVRAAAVP